MQTNGELTHKAHRGRNAKGGAKENKRQQSAHTYIIRSKLGKATTQTLAHAYIHI